MNPDVNSEITKLLKEKGFDFPKKASQNDYQGEPPTIVEVVMWLYDKHNIWINARRVWNKGEIIGFEVTIDQIDGFTETDIYNSPTEAYSEAILYTLKNLI